MEQTTDNSGLTCTLPGFAMPTRPCFQERPRGERAVSVIVLALFWIYFCWSPLFGGEQYAFRDTASLYYPLFAWIDSEWEAGRVPLWNPLDDFGAPLAADASSSVFYPGKLIFAWPGLSYDTRFAWYVSCHVLLAAFGARFAARSIGCSQIAATLAGMGYAFGGGVVFQTCNVIYLVGAAWLPWTVGATWRAVRSQHNHLAWMAFSGLAAALALLGGDPQMAAISLLVVAILLATANTELPWRRRAASGCVAVGVAVAVSSVQWILTIPWVMQSARQQAESPATLPNAVLQNDYRGVIGPLPQDSHVASIYEFSFPPWGVAEFVWPGVLGRMDLARETQWSSNLPGADRIWTPTVFCGTAIALLVLVGWQVRRHQDGELVESGLPCGALTLTRMGAGFVVASFGWYGLGWLASELQMMRGGGGFAGLPAGPVGGLYWMAVTLIPGFATFRYPAKLVTVAALMFCLLAALTLDRMGMGGAEEPGPESTHGKRRLWRLALILNVAALAAGMGIAAGVGPLDTAARHEVVWALVRGAIGMLTTTALIGLSRFRFRGLAGWLVVSVTAVELCVANTYLLGTLPRSHGDPASHRNSADDDRAVYRHPRLDEDVAITLFHMNDYDLKQATELDRRTLRPKWNLLKGTRLLGSFQSIDPRVMAVWKECLAGADEATLFFVLQKCGIDEAWLGLELPQLQDDTATEDMLADQAAMSHPLPDMQVRKIAPGERYRLALSPTLVDPFPTNDRDELRERFQTVMALLSGTCDAVIECEQARKSDLEKEIDIVYTDWIPREIQTPPGTLDMVEVLPGRVTLAASTERNALLVCADAFDSGWKAHCYTGDSGDGTLPRGKALPVYRVNGVLMGVPVPAGESRIVLRYEPVGFVPGAILSALASVVTVTWLVVACIRSCRSSQSSE